jgi:hypothetical protein
MTKKRIAISISVLAAVVLVIVVGYLVTRDTVRVTDAVSGVPIQGAQVVPIYPSFDGAAYTTDRRGIARIGGFGLPRGGYGVQISAAGYQTSFIGTYPTSENHSGWRGDNMDISLQPVAKP